ncbi:condensation domain-containing protein [Actinomycetes bacterium M1A6_2h]
MEFTELADYPVPAGTVTEWIPSVGPHASTPETAGWQDDPRPTSHVHEAHLRRTLANPTAGRESWLGTAFECRGPLDKRAFRTAVLAWIDRHEGMRTNASIDPDSGVLSRVTAPVGATDIWVIEQDTSTRSDEVFEHLQHLFDEYTSPLAWPSYAFVTLEPTDSSTFTVFFAADHSIIDGLSVVLIAHELTMLYEEARTGEPAALFGTRSYLDFGVAERAAIAGVGNDHVAISEWSRFFDRCGGTFPPFPGDIGAPQGRTAPQGGLSAWILDSREADAFSVACRKMGQGFFAGLMAAMAMAALQSSGSTRFATVTPVHTRYDPSWAASLGWFVGVSPLAFDVQESDSFGDLIARAQSEVSRVKDVARIPLDVVMDRLGIRTDPEFVVSFMDVRFAPHADRWPSINARALRSRKYDHDVYVWLNRTPQGLNISVRFPSTEQASSAVHTFVGALRSVLNTVSATGSASAVRTSSDGAVVTGG